MVSFRSRSNFFSPSMRKRFLFIYKTSNYKIKCYNFLVLLSLDVLWLLGAGIDGDEDGALSVERREIHVCLLLEEMLLLLSKESISIFCKIEVLFIDSHPSIFSSSKQP